MFFWNTPEARKGTWKFLWHKVFVTSLVPLKLHDILCLKYDMDNNNAHDIIPVVCRCPHGPAGHLLQGGQPPVSESVLAQRTHKDILLSNIGDTPATTHPTLSLGTKRTPTPLLSTSSPKRQKPTPQQGVKRPPTRPLAPKKSTKVHKEEESLRNQHKHL